MSEDSLWDHMHKLHKNLRRTRREGQSLDSLWCTTRSSSSWNIQRPSRPWVKAPRAHMTGPSRADPSVDCWPGPPPNSNISSSYLPVVTKHLGDFCRKQRCRKKISYQKALGTWKMMEDARTREIDRFYLQDAARSEFNMSMSES